MTYAPIVTRPPRVMVGVWAGSCESARAPGADRHRKSLKSLASARSQCHADSSPRPSAVPALDRSDFRAVLILLAAALRLLVAVELAFDPVGGAVEQADGGPDSGAVVAKAPGVRSAPVASCYLPAALAPARPSRPS